MKLSLFAIRQRRTVILFNGAAWSSKMSRAHEDSYLFNRAGENIVCISKATSGQHLRNMIGINNKEFGDEFMKSKYEVVII